MTGGRTAVVLLLPLALVLGGCGGGEPRPVPDVRGQRLDLAERRLDDAGLEYERVGGGTFGIVLASNWRVCDQEPKAGDEAVRVRLVVDRRCTAPTFFVPDLLGEELETARERLDRREVPYSIVGSRAGTSLVCNQNPPGGRHAAEVILYVRRSCAPPPPPTPPLLPETGGLDLAEAEELLVSRGVGFVVEPPGSESHHDVCWQDPPAGTRASSITLYVAPRC